MNSTYLQPMNGAALAVEAWGLEPSVLDILLGHSLTEKDYEDVRAQLALWATTQSTVTFESLPDAWNKFVSPPNVPGPVVLLPGSQCTNVECRMRRFNVNDLARAGQHTCPECKGTGRKPPRALRASYVDISMLSTARTGTDA